MLDHAGHALHRGGDGQDVARADRAVGVAVALEGVAFQRLGSGGGTVAMGRPSSARASGMRSSARAPSCRRRWAQRIADGHVVARTASPSASRAAPPCALRHRRAAPAAGQGSAVPAGSRRRWRRWRRCRRRGHAKGQRGRGETAFMSGGGVAKVRAGRCTSSSCRTTCLTLDASPTSNSGKTRECTPPHPPPAAHAGPRTGRPRRPHPRRPAAAGDKLPTEAAIMEEFEVSRTVVREAHLQAAGGGPSKHATASAPSCSGPATGRLSRSRRSSSARCRTSSPC
jgi:hypothetical protein